MIYGFLSDQLFIHEPMLDDGSTYPAVCYLDDNMENYFASKLTVTDPRTTRNDPTFTGKIKVHCDSSKLSATHIFTQLTVDEIKVLFSLFEFIYTSNGIAVEQLKTNIENHSDFGPIYKTDSLVLGTVYTTITVATLTTIAEYFVVSVKFGNKEETFKIWVNRSQFLEDYPLSTLSKIILPCDHKYILNPNQFPNIVEAIIGSNTFSFHSLDTDITSGDHSGLLTFYTKYNVSSTSVKMLPFGVLYKGAKPSTMDIRKSIRELLISFGTASSEVWEALLPDLFVTGQFFIVPIWDNTTIRPDRTMYPSILPTNKLSGLLKLVFPDMVDSHILAHQELLTIAQSEMFILSIPDPANDTELQLLSVHPTYQFYSPQDQTHMYMEPKTKDFSIRLNRCMSVLAGESVLEEFSENTFDERSYLSFVSYGNEYHVLTKESYMEIVS